MDDVGVLWVKVLDFAQVLQQGKAETVLALVADGEVREDEVAGGGGAVQVSHASDRGAGEDRGAGDGWGGAAGSEGTGIFKTCVQEEVGVVGKGDVLVVLEDAQLDNGRRIYRTTVGARLCTAATGTGTLRLLDHLQVIADATAVFGLAMRSILGLIGDRNDGEGHVGWRGGLGLSQCRVEVEVYMDVGVCPC